MEFKDQITIRLIVMEMLAHEDFISFLSKFCHRELEKMKKKRGFVPKLSHMAEISIALRVREFLTENICCYIKLPVDLR